MPSLGLMFSEEGRTLARLNRRSNKEWLDSMRSSRRDRTLSELRIILIRGLHCGLRTTLSRRGVEEMVEDFVQEALLRVLDNLDTFRGESRFTTWAQKIAMRVAFSELRKKCWEHLSLDTLLLSPIDGVTSPLHVADPSPNPEDLTSDSLIMDLIDDIIRKDLTSLQREALQALILQGLPIEEVARKMNTNRNALYKLLHDARKKVRTTLERRGLQPDDVLAELQVAI